MSDELELYSTDELVQELLHRATFQGIIFHSHDEFRGKNWDNKTFRLFWANVEFAEIKLLVETLREYLEKKENE